MCWSRTWTSRSYVSQQLNRHFLCDTLCLACSAITFAEHYRIPKLTTMPQCGASGYDTLTTVLHNTYTCAVLHFTPRLTYNDRQSASQTY